MYLSDIGNVHKMQTSERAHRDWYQWLINENGTNPLPSDIKYYQQIEKFTLEVLSYHESSNPQTINSFKSIEIQMKYFL